MKSVLIFSDSYLDRDPRVLVQIEALKKDHQVTCCGLSSPMIPGVKFVKFRPIYRDKLRRLLFNGPKRALLNILHFFNKFEQEYFCGVAVQRTISRLGKNKYDIILCNDVNSLPLCAVLKRKCASKLYLDAHEYTPRQWDADPAFQTKHAFWDMLLEKYAADVDLATTVCQSIADEYENEFGIRCENLVYNTPFNEPQLAPTAVNPKKIRMIHHGGLNRNRKPEWMVDLMDLLDDRFELDFMFIANDRDYLTRFKQQASRNSRIRFRDPVPTQEIATSINEYDIGLFLLDPSSFNYRNALPNKFFEFIQGRLAIATWPSHEMKRITEQHELGVVSDEFTVEAMANKLNKLSRDEIMRYKQNSDRAAAICNAERSIETIRRNVDKLLKTLPARKL